jgi:glycosyltransferase involved in cell wall biosynthesis
MKILLVVPWDQEVGGVSVIAGNLARYLHAQSHEVLFLTPGRVISPRSITTNWGFPGFEMRLQLPFGQRHPFVSLFLFAVLFPLIIYQLIRFIRREQIQIVNLHYATDQYFYFAICRRLLNVKLVTSIHGGDIFPGGGPHINNSLLSRSLFKASDLIIAPSRRFRDDFVAIFPHHAAKAHFIHNGIDLCEFRDSPMKCHRSGDTRYILSVASYHRYKGLDVLIRSFAFLARCDSGLKLLLAGDGPEREPLEELAKSLGVDDRIQFLGWQGRNQVKQLLFDCDVFVLPSRWESFGLVLLEALACGRPVVATKVVGIPEVIEEGTNGLLVEPENPLALASAIKRILTDHDLQRLFVGNGRKIVRERFRFKQTGSRYECVFGQLLSQERPSQLRATQNDP